MTQATALAKARAFKAVLLAHGVPEVSIELLPGRPATGDDWDSLQIVSNFAHHTVSSYKATSLTPVLALVKRGRSDLPGPLCNGYGGWDLTARIITFGYANHPGAGGPITVGNKRIPKDSARRYTWGWEFEGGVSTTDWNRVLTNPRNGKRMTFREFMGRCGAATQDYFNLPVSAHLEHKTWAPTRKVDRLGYTQAGGIAEIRKYSALAPKPNPATSTGDEMTLEELKAYMRLLYGPDGTEGVWNRIINGKLDLIITNQAEMKATLARIEDDTDDGSAAHAAVMQELAEIQAIVAPKA